LLFTFSPVSQDDSAFYSDWTLTGCDGQFVQAIDWTIYLPFSD
jgi:hypothetical protein